MILVPALAAFSLYGQTPAPSFEVATIRPAPPITTLAAQIQSGKAHVGMNIDGARVDIGFMSLADLLAYAYRVKPFQISGPDWMKQERFDIQAKLPDGASKDQVPEMMQALLSERFKLAEHRETKDHPVYALIPGKNGPKLVESAAEPDPPPAAALAPDTPGGRGAVSFGTPNGAVSIKQEGRGMVVTGGQPGIGATRVSMGQNGSMRMEMSKMTMAALADMLTRFVDRPVLDMTELKGTYQVALELPLEELMAMARAMAPELAGLGGPGGPGPANAPATASDPSGGSIFNAVQQLGLKLDSRKAPIETIVVDHLEKTPGEN